MNVVERNRVPNDLLRHARLRLPSPSGSGRPMSRQELADAANAYLAALDGERRGHEATLDGNLIGKLERGLHRWPSECRREAFRYVLKVETDGELGFWIVRSLTIMPAASTTGPLGRLDRRRSAGASQNEGPSGGRPEHAPDPCDADDIFRRTFLKSTVGGVGLGLLTPALTLDDIRHLAAAISEARRYLDSSVVRYLRERLVQCADEDGQRGPRVALPPVLAVLAVVEHRAREVNPVVRRELLQVGARGAEFAGWLYRDLGISDLADYWRDRATEWALEAGDHAMPGYVLLKKSQSAWDARDALRMFTLATAVQDGPWQLPDRVRAEAVQQEARALAMIDGNLSAALGKLDEAQALLASDGGGGHDVRSAQLAAHYDRTLLALQTAICHHEAGQPDQAVNLYQEVLAPAVLSPRDHAYFESLMGHALAAVGRPDDAARAGLRALPVALAATSLRTVRELHRLRRQVQPWIDRPTVREFCDAVPI